MKTGWHALATFVNHDRATAFVRDYQLAMDDWACEILDEHCAPSSLALPIKTKHIKVFDSNTVEEDPLEMDSLQSSAVARPLALEDALLVGWCEVVSG